MNRRQVLLGAAAVMGAAACGAPSGNDRLRYWNLFGGGDGVRMVELIDAFAASRPDLDVKASTLTWGPPYYTKLSMAAAGGRAPDVAILHLARLSSFAPGRLLDPFPQELLTAAGITPDRFLPAIWDRCVVDGQVYAIPLDTHPFVMYYNTELCRRLGLIGAGGDLVPLRGADDLVAAWSEARKLTGGYGLVLDTFGVSPWRLWWTLYRQLDGDLLTEDATALVIDDAKALQALDFMRRLSVTDAVAPGQMLLSGAVALFGSGKAAFLFNGEWEVTTFQTQKTPFSMVPFPEVFPGTSTDGIARTQADCHTFVLPHQRGRTAEGSRAALDYVRFMLDRSVDWAEGGHVPAWLPATRSAEYLALDPQSRYRDAAATAQLDPPAWFSGSASNMETLAGSAFGAVQAGTLTPEAGLARFKADMQRLIDTPAPV
ncbi:extracellular solute-binding protein [Catenuloplanes atrovinosus]|uniref:Multiple sugar transport system substrate-binding protein n=1 Tax=Catenuloplanes atrovinosus TaxID=137266 RepID=A0AAE4CAY5_9ACTN|nr:extracellular solute-binding protein [Catenuloplanes atrovinosus]MDR7277482.1 multiple sugar transport system substrate-binding protein [Catenuloplanes atrovinosus]